MNNAAVSSIEDFDLNQMYKFSQLYKNEIANSLELEDVPTLEVGHVIWFIPSCLGKHLENVRFAIVYSINSDAVGGQGYHIRTSYHVPLENDKDTAIVGKFVEDVDDSRH